MQNFLDMVRGLDTEIRWLFQKKGGVPIFLFHAVENRSDPWTAGHRYITPIERFREQVNWIQREYKVLSTTKLLSLLDHEDSAQPVAAIHFDDGFTSYVESALPILRELDLPSTMFLVTDNLRGHIPIRNKLAWLINSGYREEIISVMEMFIPDFGRSDSARDNILLMSKDINTPEFFEAISKLFIEVCPSDVGTPFLSIDEAKLLTLDEDIEIGSHTKTHRMLTSLKEDDQINEIVGGHKDLEHMLDHKINYFAYPFGGRGHFDDVSQRIVGGVNKVTAFSAYGGTNLVLDRLDVKRITVSEDLIRTLKRKILYSNKY